MRPLLELRLPVPPVGGYASNNISVSCYFYEKSLFKTIP
jgi:hypothetical protein